MSRRATLTTIGLLTLILLLFFGFRPLSAGNDYSDDLEETALEDEELKLWGCCQIDYHLNSLATSHKGKELVSKFFKSACPSEMLSFSEEDTPFRFRIGGPPLENCYVVKFSSHPGWIVGIHFPEGIIIGGKRHHDFFWYVSSGGERVSPFPFADSDDARALEAEIIKLSQKAKSTSTRIF